MMSTAPPYPPKFVSSFLKVDGSRLPKLTYQTIQEAEVPPIRRGGKSWYSQIDIVLMSLGEVLLRQGLTPAKTQKSLNVVRDWIKWAVTDPAAGVAGRENVRQWRWLVIQQGADGFEAELIDKEALLDLVLGKKLAEPRTIIGMNQFINAVLGRLRAHHKENHIE